MSSGHAFELLRGVWSTELKDNLVHSAVIFSGSDVQTVRRSLQFTSPPWIVALWTAFRRNTTTGNKTNKSLPRQPHP